MPATALAASEGTCREGAGVPPCDDCLCFWPAPSWNARGTSGAQPRPPPLLLLLQGGLAAVQHPRRRRSQRVAAGPQIHPVQQNYAAFADHGCVVWDLDRTDKGWGGPDDQHSKPTGTSGSAWAAMKEMILRTRGHVSKVARLCFPSPPPPPPPLCRHSASHVELHFSSPNVFFMHSRGNAEQQSAAWGRWRLYWQQKICVCNLSGRGTMKELLLKKKCSGPPPTGGQASLLLLLLLAAGQQQAGAHARRQDAGHHSQRGLCGHVQPAKVGHDFDPHKTQHQGHCRGRGKRGEGERARL